MLHGTGTQVVSARVRELSADLEQTVKGILDGRVEAFAASHDVRVELRRLRTLLGTYEPVLEFDRVRPLRRELAWLFGELGPLRDAEVISARVSAWQLTGRTAELVSAEVTARARAAHERAAAIPSSPRSAELVSHLGAMAQHPAGTSSPARAQAAEALAWAVLTNLHQRLERVVAHDDVLEATDELHEVRKEAKRVRYSVEALVPVHGRDARRLSRRAERLQEALGEVRDISITRSMLREIADRPTTTRPRIFDLGQLDERERHATRAGLAAYARHREKLLATDPRWLH